MQNSHNARSISRYWGVALGALAVVAMTGGCAGYRLGTTLPETLKTIHVPTFVNDTNEPRLETETTSATIARFQTDGALSVVPSAGAADLVMETRLTEFHLTPLRYEADNAKTPREYRMTIWAQVTVHNRRDPGKALVNTRVRGQATFDLVGDLTSSKRNGLPLASEDLGRRIVEAVVEAW